MIPAFQLDAASVITSEDGICANTVYGPGQEFPSIGIAGV
jgi:hypothetical protein